MAKLNRQKAVLAEQDKTNKWCSNSFLSDLQTLPKIILSLLCVFLIISCNENDELEQNWTDDFETLSDYTPYTDPTEAMDDRLGSYFLNPSVDHSITPIVHGTNGFDWNSIGKKVLSSAITKLGSYGGSLGSTVAGILNPIISKELFGPNPESAEVKLLNTILQNLEAMDGKLDAIIETTERIYEKIDEVELNAILSAYTDVKHEYQTLQDLNNYAYALLTATSDPKEQSEIIENWANTPINGNAAYLEVNNLIRQFKDFNYKYNGVVVNYCSALDLFVFNNVAWESAGYDYREAFRAQAAAEIARGSYLLYAYYSLHLQDNPFAKSTLESIINNLKLMESFFGDSEVVRHPDYAILQLPNHHFKWCVGNLNRSAKSVTEKFSSSSTAYGWLLSRGYIWTACYRDGNATQAVHYQWNDGRTDDDHIASPEFMKQQFSNADLIAIVEYYRTLYPNFTLLQAIEAGGITVEQQYRPEGGSETYLGTSDTEILVYTDSDEGKNPPTHVVLDNYWDLASSIKDAAPLRSPEAGSMDVNIMDSYDYGDYTWKNDVKKETVNKNGKDITRTYHHHFFFFWPKTYDFPGDNLLFFAQHSKYSYKTDYDK